jgi:CheY-like chemotaxis protein
MNTDNIKMKNIFLADDDMDDCSFFEDALNDLNISTELTISNDGIELMFNLEKVSKPPPPDIIFLDLNMPRKNGYECLDEIRNHPKFKEIPIVIFSTTDSNEVVDRTYTAGANLYVRKPNSHQGLKDIIETVLGFDLWQQPIKTPRSKFFLML